MNPPSQLAVSATLDTPLSGADLFGRYDFDARDFKESDFNIVDSKADALLNSSLNLNTLKADTPLVLLPVRVQVKFMDNTTDDVANPMTEASTSESGVLRYPRELLVRIYPDQLSIDRHEAELTESEMVAGKQYWQQALTSPDRLPGAHHSPLAWQVLIGRFGANRARWIVEQLQPTGLDGPNGLVAASDTILSQLANPGNLSSTAIWDNVLADLAQAYPEHSLTPSAWNAAAFAKCLPDRFIVALYNKIPLVKSVSDKYIKELLVDNFTVKFHPHDPATGNPPTGTEGITETHQAVLDQATYEAQVQDLTTEFLQLVRVQAGTLIDKNQVQVGLNGGAQEENGEAPDLAENGLGNKLAWLADFDKAVEVGMGMAIELQNADELDRGFDRLLVVGLRSGQDAEDEVDRLTDLLQSHAFTDGLEIVSQGTPTNNTSSAGAGYSSYDQYDAEATFKLFWEAPLFTQQSPDNKRDYQQDGQQLAEALGIAPKAFEHTGNAGRTDGQEATRFNKVLWPATFGYYMREMLEPHLCTPKTTAYTRAFFEQYVTGRGPVPAFRIGTMPYGVLPTTQFSRWMPPDKLDWFGSFSWDLIRRLDVTWTERLNAFAKYPPLFANKETPFTSLPPSQQDILTVLGQEAASVEFYQRYFIGPSLMDTFAHKAETSGVKVWPPMPNFDIGGIRANGNYSVESGYPTYPDSARDNLPARYQGEPENPLFSNFLAFFNPTKYKDKNYRLGWSYLFDVNYQVGYLKVVHTYADEPKPPAEVMGSIVDNVPISETNYLQPLTIPLAVSQSEGGPSPRPRNYIDWLAGSSFDEIYRQDFSQELQQFNGDPDHFEQPNSLLYFLLRQAVMWRYWEAAEAVLHKAGKPIDRQETELFNILKKDKARWQGLYSKSPSGNPLHEWLLQANDPEANGVQEYLKVLGSLASLPTGHLERLLAEHLDLGNHRLDAWKTGHVLARLVEQRQAKPIGSFLGAFGWLEKVKRQDESVPEPDGRRFDPDNLGYIHAPSINHGVAAAVMRQGYKSRQFTSDSTNPAANRMAINLSSERVRRALNLMEGVRTGSSLAALLGRDFEEGLFQATPTQPPVASYANYIENFRKKFPYAQEKADPTGGSRDAAPEQDARQLVDGLALLKAPLPAQPSGVLYNELGINIADAAERIAFWKAVLIEVNKLQDTLDALGDLTVGESIYQTVVGNVEQAAAMLENVAKGKFPPFPDIIHPSRTGVTLTHRVFLHLPQTPVNANDFVHWPSQPSLLAKTEPAFNNWLVSFFGSPLASSFPFTADITDLSGPDPVTTSITGNKHLGELGLHPIDLFLLLDDAALRSGSSLDLRITHQLRTDLLATHPQSEVTVTFTYDPVSQGPLQRLLPLLYRIKQLLATSRPANANDLALPGSMAPGQLHSETAEVNELEAQGRLQPAITAFEAVVVGTSLPALIAAAQDPGAGAAEQVALRTALQAQAATVGPYNVPEAYQAAAGAVTDPLSAAVALVQAIQRRLNTHTATSDEPNLTVRYAEAAKALFGGNFRFSVQFALPTSPPIPPDAVPVPDTYARAFEARGPLLRNHSQNPFVMDEWLQGLAPVRDTMNHLEKVYLLNDLLWDGEADHTLPVLTPVQLSMKAEPVDGDYWLGVNYPGLPQAANPGFPSYIPPSDALSLVQLLPDNYAATGTQQAFWLDEWVELIPQEEEDTSLVFHYDQPNMEAPQTLLLAVHPTPELNGKLVAWDWETVLGTVNESLDFAKKRAVEPANLVLTHLGAILPVPIAPVAQEEVTMTLDLRQLVRQAQFAGHTYAPEP